MLRTSTILILLILACFFTSCSKDEMPESEFTLEDEIALGERLHAMIQDENSHFDVVDQNSYPAVNGFISDCKSRLLSSGSLQNQNRFDWQIHILRGNEKNSFALPGGFIYIYADLAKENIKSGAACMGVLAHEMAIADLNLSTNKLKDGYSLSLLLDVALGNNEVAGMDLIHDIIDEPYSLEAAKAADDLVVNLICSTDIDVTEYAGFINDEIISNNSSWLITHPVYDNRVTVLNAMSSDCAGSNSLENAYTEFISQL